jgi:GT2 family glycosyltransferase
MKVSICIPTHNRRADLERTLSELRRLDPPPDEILVLADGCGDGTEEFVRAQHPDIRLLVNEKAVNCVVGRNMLMAAAAHEIVLGLDDDSYPLESDFIGRLRTLFTQRPRLAVMSFPQRTNEFPETLSVADFGPSYFAGSYVNCACALRRSVFQSLGGYPDFFYQSYDEPDYSLRCLAAGWEIYHETSLTVRHHFTPVMRNEMRTHGRHARNEFWGVLLRCPAPWLLPVALFRAARQFGYGWKRGLDWVIREPRWWLAALAGAPKCLPKRRPVSWRTYLAWMRLMRRPIFSEAEWVRIFRPSDRV